MRSVEKATGIDWSENPFLKALAFYNVQDAVTYLMVATARWVDHGFNFQELNKYSNERDVAIFRGVLRDEAIQFTRRAITYFTNEYGRECYGKKWRGE